jgi:hypothetical protein
MKGEDEDELSLPHRTSKGMEIAINVLLFIYHLRDFRFSRAL